MVAVDEDGRPSEIPAFVPSTDIDRRRHRAADLRRELRREFEARFRAVANAVET